ncbi:MAG: DUF4175 family protein, partial [Vicinamibacterales bacterium]
MFEHGTGPATALVDVIRQVRLRWRRRLVARGLVQFLLAAVGVVLAAAWALEALRFTPAAILGFRVVTLVAVGAAAYGFLVRPLRRRVTDEQVALYLEEHEPTLEATILSALEAERAGDRASASPALVARLVEEAIDRCHRIEEGRRIERAQVRRSVIGTAIVAVATAAVFLFGPVFLRQAVSALVLVSRSVEAASPYRIEVTPGDVTVPKGADQAVRATLEGFDATDVALVVRRGASGAFERVPMVSTDGGPFEGLLFDLAEPIEYFVEASGVRSKSFTLDVVELPYARQIDLEYTFPAYTGLAPRTIEDGGDIAVLKGTAVAVRITPTMPASAGRLVLGEDTSVPLTVGPDGTLGGGFTAEADGFYRVELAAAGKDLVAASPQFTIDVLADIEPSVRISEPARDTDATPIEEFRVEAMADDDFAVRDLQLVYQVNGGPEQTLRLYGGSQPLKEVTAGHTFYLEELGVEPGDALSYYARVSDNDQVAGPKRATSDIYFLRIRPFDKDFRQATSQGGGGGGGGGGGDVGALSKQQREIIAGTFNVQRDRRTMTADQVRES